jgi:hypothetical protein
MLNCPACGTELESLACPACEKANPPDALYCCYCGGAFGPVAGQGDLERTEGDPFDPENRVLCSDETCIGIINEQGVCSECGRPRDPSA